MATCRDCNGTHETMLDGVRCDVATYGEEAAVARLGSFAGREVALDLVRQSRMPSGAERYLASRMQDPEYRDAFDTAARALD